MNKKGTLDADFSKKNKMHHSSTFFVPYHVTDKKKKKEMNLKLIKSYQ